MTTLPDPATVAAIIAETAAEEIMPRFRDLKEGEVKEKSPGELVTVVDEAAERVLERRLGDLLPGSLAVGEEAAARDASVLDAIAAEALVWIIDPLDGTTNFTNGDPRFAVIVALVAHGETVAGWIHDPSRGRTAVTEHAGGAFLDGARMQVSAERDLARMQAILTERYFQGRLLAGARRLRGAVASTRAFSCAGLAYLDLCSGAAEIATPARLRPWDHAAGALMHGEAGGHNNLADGSRYRPTVHSGLFILAPDRASWTDVRALMTAPEDGAT